MVRNDFPFNTLTNNIFYNFVFYFSKLNLNLFLQNTFIFLLHKIIYVFIYLHTYLLTNYYLYFQNYLFYY